MTPPIDCAPLLEARDLDEMAEWAAKRPVRHGWKGRTCRELWDAAPRGDWLLGYAEEAGADQRDLVRAAAACARPALRFVPAGEARPRLAVEAAERWVDRPTEANRRRAAEAADAVWAVWEASSASSAAAAAGAAGYVSGAAGSRAVRAADAAWAAAEAHGGAEGPESMVATHRSCADEVRRLVPFLDLHAAGGGAR